MKFGVTKRLATYLAVLALSLAPAALVNGVAGYLPALTLLLCGVLSLGQLLLVINRLEFGAEPGRTDCVRGDSVPFDVVVRNGSILPVPALRAVFYLSDLEGCDSQTLPLSLTLSPRERRTFRFSADFDHIGVYTAGVRELIAYDLFGIFRAVRRVEERRRLEIQPRVEVLDRLPVEARQQTESSRALAPSPLGGMDYTGVREYAFGDPIKTIQWKLSAHAGGLLTKQMESYTHTGVSVVLDFQVPGYDGETRLNLFDAVVEAGAAAGDWTVRSGLDCDLLFFGADGEKRRFTPRSFRDLGGYLPHMRLPPPGDRTREAAALLREDCAGVYGQSNVVCCTARLTEELIAALLALKRQRKNPCLFYLVPDTVYDQRRRELLAPLKRLQYAQIPCAVASSAKALAR